MCETLKSATRPAHSASSSLSPEDDTGDSRRKAERSEHGRARVGAVGPGVMPVRDIKPVKGKAEQVPSVAGTQEAALPV